MGRIAHHIKKAVDEFIDSSYTEKVSIITPTVLTKPAILKCKPSHIDDEIWIQSCKWIIHSIIQLSFDKRFNNKAKDYVSLYSNILKDNCGNNYKIYVEGLVNCGIIECDGIYSISKHKSFGFKLTDKYSSSPLKHITLTEPSLIKRIRNYRKERITQLKIKAAPIANLIIWLTNDNLKLDKVAALECLERYKRFLTRELAKRNLKPKYQKEQEAFVLKRYYRIKCQLENWNTNKYISIDDAGGRLYSPITGLPSLFRNFLTYKEEELVGFDIKNSQPLHFLTMLKKEFWKSYTPGLTLKRLDQELWEYLQEEREYSTTIMFQESSETQSKQGFTNYSFKKLVQTGKLYEFICFKFFNKHTTKGELDRFNTRAKTKQEFMHMMYHNPEERYSKAKAVFADFMSLFPIEATVMKLMKKRKYTDFPIILQKIEAQMLLHRVAKKVYDIDPDIPLFTIHDSILTTKKYTTALKSILDKEYQILLGFIPQFEKTVYSEDNAYKEINKYTKSKVDQADLEISEVGSIFPESFRFLKCEHWDFDSKFLAENKKALTTKVPDFAKYKTMP